MSTEEKPAPQDATPPATPVPGPSPAKPVPAKGVAFRKRLDTAGKTKALDGLATRSERREARDAAGGKAYSVGDQLQKSSKPVSTVMRTIKLLLILVIVVGIPGIVTASFFVKVGKKGDVTVAMKFWKRIRELLGWAEPPKPFKPGRHPNLETLEAVEKGVERDQFEVAGLDKTLSKHDDKDPWTKEDALRIHEQLDEIAARIDRRAGTLAQLLDWLKEYNQLKGEAEKAHVEGIGTDSMKQDCIQLMLRKQPIPSGLQETAKDPGVQKYYELMCRMELDEYAEVAIEEARLGATGSADTKLRGQLRQLRSRLPSKMSLGVGGEAPVKETVAPFDPKRFHPWARAAAGTWVRTRVTLADGAVSHEDRIVKEVREDALVFTGQRSSGDQVTDDPEREEKFVPAEFKAAGEEKLKVGDLEVLCAIFQVGEEKRWIAREGRWANRVVLKTGKAGKETPVTKLGEEPLPFKERQFNCIAYEIGGVKFWAHEDIPGFVFKVQMEAMTREVVDFGPALAGRPPLPKAEKKPEEPKKEEPPKMEEPKKEEPKKEEPKKEEPPKEEPKKEEPKKEEPKKEEPPPKMEEPKKEEPRKEEPKKEEPPKEEPRKEPPPKSVDVVLAEADKLLVDGAVIFREILEASKQLPDNQDQLRALLKRQEEGVSLFTRAREAYLSVTDKASPEAKVEERLGKIEKILALLQKYGDGIKSKLK